MVSNMVVTYFGVTCILLPVVLWIICNPEWHYCSHFFCDVKEYCSCARFLCLYYLSSWVALFPPSVSTATPVFTVTLFTYGKSKQTVYYFHKQGPPDTYLAWFIIYITVIEHDIKIFNALFSTGIHIFLQFSFNFAHVHWMFDNIIIILTKYSHLASEICPTTRLTASFEKFKLNFIPASLI